MPALSLLLMISLKWWMLRCHDYCPASAQPAHAYRGQPAGREVDGEKWDVPTTLITYHSWEHVTMPW